MSLIPETNRSTLSSCPLNLLAPNRLHNEGCGNLYELYKVICTLSVNQVQCVRTFSKLIKTRLRNSLFEENLGSYMFLAIENELLNELDAEAIIDRFAQWWTAYKIHLCTFELSVNLKIVQKLFKN